MNTVFRTKILFFTVMMGLANFSYAVDADEPFNIIISDRATFGVVVDNNKYNLHLHETMSEPAEEGPIPPPDIRVH